MGQSAETIAPDTPEAFERPKIPECIKKRERIIEKPLPVKDSGKSVNSEDILS
jgi:hypothetical protein